MKLTTSIFTFAIAVMATGAWAQNPDAIDNARNVARSLQQKQTVDSNAALDAAGTPAGKPAPGTGAKPQGSTSSTTQTPTKPVFAPGPVVKPITKTVKAKPVQKKPAVKVAAKTEPAKPTKIATIESKAPEPVAKPEAAPKPEDKKWAMSGKRDPFFSPVVQATNGSGCSTGKKCLEIGHINLHGIVKSDSGFIAVVTNDLNKAYFLHENDPVFNGYVVRITGDSVVFQETVQDKLGKPFTREVVKRIFTPAV